MAARRTQSLLAANRFNLVYWGPLKNRDIHCVRQKETTIGNHKALKASQVAGLNVGRQLKANVAVSGHATDKLSMKEGSGCQIVIPENKNPRWNSIRVQWRKSNVKLANIWEDGNSIV